MFATRWNDIALKIAPATTGWNDLTNPTHSFRLRNFAGLDWQNTPGFGNEQWGHLLANEGTPVILAHATNNYLDLAYNKDPDETGYYWSGYVDDKATFTYQPENMLENLTHDRFGQPFTVPDSWVRLSPEGRKNILGIEAQLFGENRKSPEIREYQAFPKLLGMVERSWARRTPGTAQMPAAFDLFSNTLGQVTLPLLSFYQPVGLPGSGVNYRIPLPGGRISGGTLTANVRNPGLAIEYSTDGELFRAARPSTGRAPDVSPGSWTLLR